MKKVLLIAGSIVVALLIAIVVVPSFFDWNTQKERIETAASQALGQPVRIAGDISLSLLPTPRLRAEGLSMGDSDALEDGPFVSAGLLDIRVAFWPLLSGTVEAGEVVLRDANIAVLTGQEKATSDTPAGETETPDIRLPDVEIDNATITFIDAATRSETTISKIDLNVSAKSISGPFSVDGSVRYNEAKLALSLQTGDINTPDFPFELRVLSNDAANLSLAFAGNATDVLSDNARADGKITVTTPDAGRALNALTGSQNDALTAKAFNLSAPVSFEKQVLTMNDLRLDFDGLAVAGTTTVATGTRPITIKAAFEGNKLDLSPFIAARNPGDPLIEDFALSFPQDIEAQISLDIAELTGFPVSLKRVSAEARLSNERLDIARMSAMLPGGVTAQGRGTFQAPTGALRGTFNAKIDGANAQSLLSSLMGAGAALPPAPTPIDLSLDGALEDSGLRIGALVGKLGQTQINASGKLAYGPKPLAEVRGNIRSITLADWTQPAGAETAPAAQPFDGDLRFDIALSQLRMDAQFVEAVALKGSLKNDILTLQSATVGDSKTASVTVSGKITDMARAAPKLDLNVEGSAQSLNQMLALGGIEPIDAAQSAGALTFSGTVKGSQSAPNVSAAGTLGKMAFESETALSGIDTDAPKAAGTATVKHPSLAGLMSTFDFIDQSAVAQGAGPITITTSFDASAYKTSASTQLVSSGGTADVTYALNEMLHTFELATKAVSLTDYIRSLGFAFDPAGARLGGLNIAAKISGPVEALTLSTLNANIGPATLTGTGKFDLSGEVSVVDLRLSGKNLDLAELMPEPETGAQAAAQGIGERWSKEPLDFAMLEKVDGTVSLELDRLTLRDYELKDARLTLVSSGKTLSAGLDRGTLFNGPASFSLALDAKQTPQVSVDLAFQDGDIAKAAQSSAAIEPLTGTFEFSGSFKGAGVSEYAIIKSLAGSASFAARDGVINGVNIVTLNERFGSLSTVNDFLRIIGSALKGGQTAYRLIAVDIASKNGILTTRNMRADIDGGAKAALDSRIDLPAWRIDANGAFSLEDHPDAPPVSVSINGALDGPVIAYDTKKLQSYIGVRLGTAVLKGVFTGEGVGLKDLVGSGKTQDTSTTQDGASSSADTALPTTQDTSSEEEASKTPEEELRDLILRGLFGKKKS